MTTPPPPPEPGTRPAPPRPPAAHAGPAGGVATAAAPTPDAAPSSTADGGGTTGPGPVATGAGRTAPLDPVSLAVVLGVGVAVGGLVVRDGDAGVGVAVSLVLAALAAGLVAHRVAPLGAHARVAVGAGALTVAQWAVSDAEDVLALATLLCAGAVALTAAGPRSGAGHVRLALLAPAVAVEALVATTQGALGLRGRLRGGLAVPVAATVLVLLVFGSLLAGADPVFGDLLAQVVPDLDGRWVARFVVGGMAAVAVATVATGRRRALAAPPEAELVRPRADWLAPVVALDVLFAAFLALQAGGLFGGAARVAAVEGLTYAGYARSGVFQLLTAAALVLVVTGVVVRVAAPADVRVRDLALGVLLGSTGVLLASAAHRLWTYEQAYGSTPLRLSAAAVLAWVALCLGLVVAARVRPALGPDVVRTCVVLLAVVACGFVAVRPDAVVARRNVARWATAGELDTALLATLSADARPALAALPTDGLDPVARVDLERLGCPDPDPDEALSWNRSRQRARALGC